MTSGMAVEPVAQPPEPRQREIFAHGQGVDVAHAAQVEIARGGVMRRMGAAPEIVRREREHAERAADPVVDQAMAEEGAVPAIVLDHEQPHQETGGRHGERQGEPVIAEDATPAHIAIHKAASGSKVTASSVSAARAARLAIAVEDQRPVARAFGA